MKRHLLTLVLSGLVGSLVLAGNAEACHKKKCTCAPAPCAVAEPCPAPAPVCEPTCAPKKCGLFAHMKGMKLGCHKRAVCAEVVPCETVAYSAPVYSWAPSVYSSPQVSAQH
jgi:hypothetical protein